MKVKVNIINTWCIPMSEAVTMQRLMMMTSIVSEESLSSGRRRHHTHTHTHTHTQMVKQFSAQLNEWEWHQVCPIQSSTLISFIQHFKNVTELNVRILHLMGKTWKSSCCYVLHRACNAALINNQIIDYSIYWRINERDREANDGEPWHQLANEQPDKVCFFFHLATTVNLDRSVTVGQYLAWKPAANGHYLVCKSAK